jgi:hypothetical protein
MNQVVKLSQVKTYTWTHNFFVVYGLLHVSYNGTY